MINRIAIGAIKPAMPARPAATAPLSAGAVEAGAKGPTMAGDRNSAVANGDWAVSEAPDLAKLDWSGVDGASTTSPKDEIAQFKERYTMLMAGPIGVYAVANMSRSNEELERQIKALKRKIENAIATGDLATLASLAGIIKTMMSVPGMDASFVAQLGGLLTMVREGFKEALKPLKAKVEAAVASGNVNELAKLASVIAGMAAMPGLDASIYRDLRTMLVDIRAAFKEALAPIRKKMEEAIASGDFNALMKIADAAGDLAATPGLDASIYKDLRMLISEIREAFPKAMKPFERKMQQAIASGDINAMQALAAVLSEAADGKLNVDATMRNVLRKDLAQLRDAIRNQMKLDAFDRLILSGPKKAQ